MRRQFHAEILPRAADMLRHHCMAGHAHHIGVHALLIAKEIRAVGQHAYGQALAAPQGNAYHAQRAADIALVGLENQRRGQFLIDEGRLLPFICAQIQPPRLVQMRALGVKRLIVYGAQDGILLLCAQTVQRVAQRIGAQRQRLAGIARVPQQAGVLGGVLGQDQR